jgi:hypothetical protein
MLSAEYRLIAKLDDILWLNGWMAEDMVSDDLCHGSSSLCES